MQLVEVDVSTFNRRFRVELDDGAAVEAVLYRGDTLCVSSQVGCAVRCPFCASGARGLTRGLSLEELRGQVAQVQALGHSVVRVTVSGVGEPLHNHENVREFVGWCRAQRIGPSLTTSGGPLGRLEEWLGLPHNGLTISVHAGSEAVRAELVPRGPPLTPLFASLREHLPKLTRARRKKVALAYLLIGDANDSEAEVDAFLERALPLGLAVHLYAYNPVPTSQHRPLSRARYEAIYQRMRAAGMVVRMSSQARVEANGGCGTLLAARPSERAASPVLLRQADSR
ncbi:MAG: Ribosomal large subunit methyltransferase [Myxococcaceae bacterium]|nr:Ribosomal large subunit methyltransferase [Myxococcaceae bacterium]